MYRNESVPQESVLSKWFLRFLVSLSLLRGVLMVFEEDRTSTDHIGNITEMLSPISGPWIVGPGEKKFHIKNTMNHFRIGDLR